MIEVPNSWAITPIVDVLALNENKKSFQQGWSPQCENYAASDKKWGVLKTTAIQPGEFWDHENKQLLKSLDPRPHIEVRAGDLLMTCAGPRLRCGVVCLIERTRSRLMISGKIYRFRSNEEVMDPRFLAYFMQSRSAQAAIDAMKTGISDSGLNLTQDRFAKLPVPVAPAVEQRRIVSRIEELFSELDKGVESLIIAREQLKVYRQSVLNKVVIGELSSSFGFPSKPLSTVVEELGQGWSPRCLNHPSADDKMWAVITTTAIQHGVFREEENKQLPEDLKPRPNLSIRAGDILITRAGPRKRVGVACLVRHCRPRLMLCDKAYRLRADTSQVLPEWLELILNSPSILHEIEELKTGISDSGVNLTQNRFLALDIPIPTLAQQRAVLKLVDCLVSQIANLETQIKTAMQQSDALRQAILKRAFSGQLVPQDDRDEPASVLLKRNRAEEDDGNKQKPRSRRNNGRKETA